MKIQLDTNTKTISIEGTHDFSEIIKNLNKLLPNNEWKKWKLNTSTPISYWVYNPIPINYWIAIPYDYPSTPNYIPYRQPTYWSTINYDTVTYSDNNIYSTTYNNDTINQSQNLATHTASYSCFNKPNDTVGVNIEMDNFGTIQKAPEGIFCIEC